MRLTNIVVLTCFMGLATQPLLAAVPVDLSFGGKVYRVEVNAVLMKVCAGQSLSIVSPRDAIISSGDDAAGIKTFPLELVKKGTYMDAARLVGKGETFPFDVELKGAKVSDALVRSNGTWSMTVTWTSCANVATKKQ
jgi:hypothetical protein